MKYRHPLAHRAVIVVFGVAILAGAAACSSGSGSAGQPDAAGATATGTGTGQPSDSAAPTPTPSLTPKPKPTPTVGPTRPKPQASSSKPGSQAPRTGKPGPSNTGVVPGTKLTVVTGSQTFSTNGAVISGKDFHGFVKVKGKNITFKDCIFRGAAASGNAWLLDTGGGTNTVVEDSEFVPSNPSSGIDDMWADNVSIYRANIHGGVDGVKTGSNVLVQDSYIHDMTWFAHDANQNNGPTHNDGVQGFLGDSNVTLRHNNIDLSGTKDGNAGLQDSASNVHVDGNWLNGGGCTLNFNHVDKPLSGIFVTNNRFGRATRFNCPILISTETTLNQNSGNVWDDTGKPIPAPQQHD